MKLSLGEIFKFGDCTASSKNFVEGERILHSNHILNCGIIETNTPQSISILASCLGTNLKGEPYKLKVEIKDDGQIDKFECSCEEGLNKKCKHILAVLLYCYRHGIDNLEVLPYTNDNCISEEGQKKSQEYKAIRLQDHECFAKAYKGCDEITLSDDQIKMIKETALSTGENLFTKHMSS